MKSEPNNIKIVAKYEKRGIKAFLKFLKREKIFDISDGNVKQWKKFSGAYVQVGQPAEVSDQGTKLTCASHAMGKVLVEILNNFYLDCDQKKIIEDLITNVQPTGEAVPIYKFNFSKIDLEFWDSTSEKQEKIQIQMVIQHKIVNESWKIPAMSLQELDEHNTKVLAVYKPPKQPNTFHAVFVKSFEENPKNKNEYTFYCLNSWGDEIDPEPVISSKDMVALHYISLIESKSGKDLVEAGATPFDDADSDEVLSIRIVFLIFN